MRVRAWVLRRGMKAGDPKSAARELQATWQRSVSGRGRAEAAGRGSEVRAGTRGPWGEGARGAGGRDGLTGRQTQRWGPPTVRRAAHHGLSSPLLVPGTSQPLGPPDVRCSCTRSRGRRPFPPPKPEPRPRSRPLARCVDPKSTGNNVKVSAVVLMCLGSEPN